MQNQPKYLVIENVVGFETSRTAAALRLMLSSAGYESQEFILSPLQLGIPYSRPRYFCIARKVIAHSGVPNCVHSYTLMKMHYRHSKTLTLSNTTRTE